MTIFFAVVVILLGFILMISSTKWNLSKALLRKTESSDFKVYNNKRVYVSAKLVKGESAAIPISCKVLMNENKLHLIPTKFHALLFMTDYPFTFYKKDNRKLKIHQSELSELVFTCKQRKPSVFGKVFNVRIEIFDEERRALLNILKTWR